MLTKYQVILLGMFVFCGINLAAMQPETLVAAKLVCKANGEKSGKQVKIETVSTQANGQQATAPVQIQAPTVVNGYYRYPGSHSPVESWIPIYHHYGDYSPQCP